MIDLLIKFFNELVQLGPMAIAIGVLGLGLGGAFGYWLRAHWLEGPKTRRLKDEVMAL